jgi:hypothetical protein
MKERIYSKQDPEYIKNGHYRIDSAEWMSMWAFKKEYGLSGNSEEQNGSDTAALLQGFTMCYKCIPDFGKGDYRYIFEVNDLKNAFDIQQSVN